MIRMKKSANHMHYLTFSLRIRPSWRFGAGVTYLPTGIRTAAVPYESTPASSRIITYPCRMGQILRINSPYLTYAFTMFTYQPYTVTRMNYTIFMAIRTPRSSNRAIRTRAVSVEWRYARTNPLRTIQTTLRTLQYRPYKTYC